MKVYFSGYDTSLKAFNHKKDAEQYMIKCGVKNKRVLMFRGELQDRKGFRFSKVFASEEETQNLGANTHCQGVMTERGDYYLKGHKGSYFSATHIIACIPKMQKNIKELRSVIFQSIGIWIGADWSHNLEINERYPNQETPTLCYGEENCSYCMQAEKDAQEADTWALNALEAIDDGDLDRAHEYIQEASKLESHYGDNPTWDPALHLFEKLNEIEEE